MIHFLSHFSIGVWVNTNQSTLLEPAHIVNKGGFNTDKKGENMNYGIWFVLERMFIQPISTIRKT
ncbi:MAG: hypothetical protein DA328_06990 [Nitrososphaeraceae archaeon]|nr:hypothetical protein [Nitrososphaeraceae archaeon]